jgi:hypothetical protein
MLSVQLKLPLNVQKNHKMFVRNLLGSSWQFFSYSHHSRVLLAVAKICIAWLLFGSCALVLTATTLALLANDSSCRALHTQFHRKRLSVTACHVDRGPWYRHISVWEFGRRKMFPSQSEENKFVWRNYFGVSWNALQKHEFFHRNAKRETMLYFFVVVQRCSRNSSIQAFLICETDCRPELVALCFRYTFAVTSVICMILRPAIITSREAYLHVSTTWFFPRGHYYCIKHI